MTREEAIKVLKKELQIIDDPNVTMTAREWEEHDDHMRDALDMATEALQQEPKMVHRETLEQVMWERDIAIEQLKELGYGLGEKIRTDEALEQESSCRNTRQVDIISRQDAIDAVIYDGITTLNADERKLLIEQIPSAKPKRGKWIKKEHLVPLAWDSGPLDWDKYDEKTHSELQEYWHCSECDYEADRNFRPSWEYCPSCGSYNGGDQIY